MAFFDKQLHERLELVEREKRDAIALAEAKVTKPGAIQRGAAAVLCTPDLGCD